MFVASSEKEKKKDIRIINLYTIFFLIKNSFYNCIYYFLLNLRETFKYNICNILEFILLIIIRFIMFARITKGKIFFLFSPCFSSTGNLYL